MELKGKVELTPQKKISSRNKPYCFFTLRDEGTNLHKVLAFGDSYERILAEDLQSGDRIICDCKEAESKEKDGILSHFLNGYTMPDKKPSPAKKRIEYETAEAKKIYREQKERREKEGFRLVMKGTEMRWREVEDCVKVDGVWEDRLEWIQKVLGAEKVAMYFSSLGYTLSNVPPLAEWRKAVRDVLGLAVMEYGSERVELET